MGISSMKNFIKLPCVICLLIIAGCENQSIITTTHHCKDEHTVTVNHAAASLRAVPAKIEDLCSEGTLKIRTVPPVASEKAESSQDSGTPVWLNGKTNAQGLIELTAPLVEGANKEFKYSIKVDDVGILDPIIIIVPR